MTKISTLFYSEGIKIFDQVLQNYKNFKKIYFDSKENLIYKNVQMNQKVKISFTIQEKKKKNSSHSERNGYI